MARTVKEDVEYANQIIQDECIPALREKFLYMKMEQDVMKAVLYTCRDILRDHESKGELSLKGIDINVQPGVGGHLSVWATESQDSDDN